MTYDQQKREVIANAKHLVELLEEMSDENPCTLRQEREYMQRIATSVDLARYYALLVTNLKTEPQ